MKKGKINYNLSTDKKNKKNTTTNNKKITYLHIGTPTNNNNQKINKTDTPRNKLLVKKVQTKKWLKKHSAK